MKFVLRVVRLSELLIFYLYLEIQTANIEMKISTQIIFSSIETKLIVRSYGTKVTEGGLTYILWTFNERSYLVIFPIYVSSQTSE